MFGKITLTEEEFDLIMDCLQDAQAAFSSYDLKSIKITNLAEKICKQHNS